MSLIIASVFYDMQPYTSSFFQRGALIFFAVLMSAFGSSLEVSWKYTNCQTFSSSAPLLTDMSRS